MSFAHKELAAGGWGRLTFIEKMANIGSEVSRSLNWQLKNNKVYSEKAAERALELIDLTLNDTKSLPRLKELSRVREAIVDYFFGKNQFQSSEALWRKYFTSFAYAARKDR